MDIEEPSCWKCLGEGWWHDCGEDFCACAMPEDDIMCDVCKGDGYLKIEENRK